MQNIYRETFEQIHAYEQLRKEVANVPKQEKAAFRHHISKAGLIAAALALERCGRSLALDAGQPLLDGADVARRMVGSPLDRHGGAARQPASGAGRGV